MLLMEEYVVQNQKEKFLVALGYTCTKLK